MKKLLVVATVLVAGVVSAKDNLEKIKKPFLVKQVLKLKAPGPTYHPPYSIVVVPLSCGIELYYIGPYQVGGPDHEDVDDYRQLMEVDFCGW
jgi:hypothetical protein